MSCGTLMLRCLCVDKEGKSRKSSHYSPLPLPLRRIIKRILATIALIIAVTFFAPPAFASVNSSNPDSTVITGKDIVDASLPLIVEQTAKSPENTFGRLVRLSGTGGFFDIGIDEQGNFFINTPEDTKTSHALTISSKGVVTIPAK